MRYVLLLTLITLASCNEKKGLSAAKDYKSHENFKKLAQEIVPCESINFSYFTESKSLIDRKAMVFKLLNPEIDLSNDSITYSKANILKKLVRSEIKDIGEFNGFSIQFQNEEQKSDSVIKQENVIFKFNTTD